MERFGKKLTAAVLAAVMIGTAPEMTVFADGNGSSLITYDAKGSSNGESLPESTVSGDTATTIENTEASAESAAAVETAAESAGTAADTEISGTGENILSSSTAAEEKTAEEEKQVYDVTASGFADDKYEMTAESITDKDILSEIEKLMDGREVTLPVEISVTEGVVSDVEKGVEVTLHGLDLADTDGVGLYHIADFETGSPKVEKLDYKAEEEAKAAEDGTHTKTVTFTTRSFSPFVFAKMTDEELTAEKEKQLEKAGSESRAESTGNTENTGNMENTGNTGKTENQEAEASAAEESSKAQAEDGKGSAAQKEEAVQETPAASDVSVTNNTGKTKENADAVTEDKNTQGFKESETAETAEATEKTETTEKTEEAAEEKNEQTQKSGEDKETTTPSPAAKAGSARKAVRAAANSLSVTELTLSADLSGGADRSTHVWTPSSDESDHAYIYQVGYTTSGTGSFAPGQFSITVPKRLLKDRSGKYADSYDMSVPNESEEGLSDVNALVYKEERNNIVVYNRLELPAAQKGYIEIAYRTNKKTWEYADYAADGSGTNGKNPCSDTFKATFTAGTKTAEATAPAVYMDTHAEVTGTEKQSPLTLHEDWNPSWGSAPSDAEDYYYLVWNIRTYIDANQPYTYTVTDNFSDYGDVVGVKYAEESKFTAPHSITLKQAFKKQYRTDTVITRIARATYASKNFWTVKNTETVTVRPTDGVDADSKASSSKTFSYEIPHFVQPIGHFDAEKYGLDYKGDRVEDAGDLCLLDDTVSSFVDGTSKTLGPFKYAAVVLGFPYPWTLEEGADPTNPDNYGKVPVTYSITDDTLKLYDETTGQTTDLGGGDYTISGISIKYQCVDADYNATTCKYGEAPTPKPPKGFGRGLFSARR